MEAASAEAVNARQGITGRLDSGVINGIIGVQVLLKKRKLDQPKKKCPRSLKDSPSVLDDKGWGSVSIGGAGSAEPLLLAWDAYHKLSMVYDATVLSRPPREAFPD